MAVAMVPLGEFCTINKGLSYKGEYIDENGPALLGMGTITEGGGFRSEKVRTYGGPYKTRQLVNPGDVYLALTNMAEITRKFLGSAVKIPDDFPTQGIVTHHVAKVTWKTDDILMRDYLYWLMRTDGFLQHCADFGTGTTVHAVSSVDVERFEVPESLNENQIIMTRELNSIVAQERVLNDERLGDEEMVRIIFCSWFMNFDVVKAKESGIHFQLPESTVGLFPNSFQDSEIGPIPTGWSVGTVHDLGRQRREIRKPDSFTDEDHYVGLKHFTRGSLVLTDWGDTIGIASNKFQFTTGDILFGKLRPYLHKVAPSPVDGVCSTDILVLQPTQMIDHAFLLSIVSSTHFIDFVSGLCEGVGLPRTKWGHFKFYEFALPPPELRARYSATVQPILDRINISIHQSKELELRRKILLGRLQTGMLD